MKRDIIYNEAKKKIEKSLEELALKSSDHKAKTLDKVISNYK